jgi:hypothetical protein
LRKTGDLETVGPYSVSNIMNLILGSGSKIRLTQSWAQIAKKIEEKYSEPIILNLLAWTCTMEILCNRLVKLKTIPGFRSYCKKEIEIFKHAVPTFKMSHLGQAMVRLSAESFADLILNYELRE